MRRSLLLAALLHVTAASGQTRGRFGAPRVLARPADSPAPTAATFSDDDASVVLVATTANGSQRRSTYARATGRRVADPADAAPSGGRFRLQYTAQFSGASCRVEVVERGTGLTRILGSYAQDCGGPDDPTSGSFSADGSRVVVDVPLEGAPAGTTATVFDASTGGLVARSSYRLRAAGGADPVVGLTPRGNGLIWSHGRVGVALLRLGSDTVIYTGPAQSVISPTLRWSAELPGWSHGSDTYRAGAVLRAIGGDGSYPLGAAPSDASPTAVFSDDGAWLALSLGDAVSLWDVASPTPRRVAAGTLRGVRALAISHDARTLAAVTDSGAVLLPTGVPARPPAAR